jgi:hypothetical protein
MKIGITAPDWRPGQPSTFERIGPAWADVWSYLGHTSPDWRSAQEIMLTPTVARHDLARKTIENMLRSARDAGLLQVNYRRRGDPCVRRACYRIRTSPRP